MRVALLSLSLLFLSVVLFSSAHAQQFPEVTLSLTWDPPLAFSDLTPVGPGDIAGYLVCLALAPIDEGVVGCGPHDVENVPDGDAISATIPYRPTVASGTLYIRIRAVDQAGIEGAFSNEVLRPFVVSVPPQPGDAYLGAPVNLRWQ